MRIAVLGQGTRGDLYPLLGIARGLVARGHHVRVLEFDEYAGDVEDAGLVFDRVGTGSQCGHVFAQVPSGGRDAWREFTIDRLYAEASLASASAFVAHLLDPDRRPDALLAPAFHVGAELAAERLGVPLVSVLLGPHAMLRSEGADGRSAERRVRAEDRLMLPRVNAVRSSLGLPLLDRYVERASIVGVMLGPVPLLPHVPTSSGLVTAGYPSYFGSTTALPPEVAAFVADGAAPLVLCTVGDGWAQQLPPFLLELVDLAEAGDVRVLLVTGRATLDVDVLPASVRATRAVHLELAMREASVAVHHGGMGAIVAAFRGGTPSVISAQWPDGRRNAAQLQSLGLAIDVGPYPSPGVLGAAVVDVLHDAARRDRVERVRDAMGTQTDPVDAVEHVLAAFA